MKFFYLNGLKTKVFIEIVVRRRFKKKTDSNGEKFDYAKLIIICPFFDQKIRSRTTSMNKRGKNAGGSKKKKTTDVNRHVTAIVSRYAEINADAIKKFSDFPLSKNTLLGLKNGKYFQPTEIQRQAIAAALRGADVLGAAKTGSGKTLAFLVPVLESLWRSQWSQFDGLGALILSPTRELALQIYEVLCKIGSRQDFSAALIIGGTVKIMLIFLNKTLKNIAFFK